MKRLILLIVTLAAAATRLFAAHLCPSTGRVVDEQGKAVEYATVHLCSEEKVRLKTGQRDVKIW